MIIFQYGYDKPLPMLKKIVEILGDRTISSLLLSILGLVAIIGFVILKRPKGQNKP